MLAPQAFVSGLNKIYFKKYDLNPFQYFPVFTRHTGAKNSTFVVTGATNRSASTLLNHQIWV